MLRLFPARQASAEAEEDEAPAPRPSGAERMPIQQSSAGALGQFSWRIAPAAAASAVTGTVRAAHDMGTVVSPAQVLQPCLY